MTKFKIEIINKSGQIKKRTILVPKSFDGTVKNYLMLKVHKLIEPEPKYRHTESAFWREWEVYEYYKI